MSAKVAARRAAGWTRRGFFARAGLAAALAARPARAAERPRRGGTLRFVPQADLSVLDPIWTTAYITRNHGYMVYDTLFGTDAQLQIRPQMVERFTTSRDGLTWTFTLREGLRWHDGAPVTADDCVASLRRWGQRDALGRLLLAATGRLQATGRRAFALELKEPFGLVLEALGKPSSNVPFMLPARLAKVPESEQVKDPIGSGPFRFAAKDWQPGHQVVYERYAEYEPRAEPPSGTAGGKRVYVDRCVWRYIPDPQTAAAALEAGEVDFWEQPPLDFVSRVEADRNLVVFVTDPRGTQGWLRPNHLHPPFDRQKARQALLHLVDQEAYLQAAVGQPRFYRACPSYFMCGLPYESAAGMPARPDPGRAKALLAEAGYDGRPIVVLDPTDRPVYHAVALVTAELLRQIGAAVDLQAMDWSTLVTRRARKDPPQRGGWNLISTWWVSADVMTPAVNAGVSGAGDAAWFGWPSSARLEQLRRGWVRATDPARRKQLAEQIQAVAADEVPYVPLGQFQWPSFHRKTVRGVIENPVSVLWNIWLDG